MPPHKRRAEYIKLEAPTAAVPVTYFGGTETGLFTAILNRCVREGQVCIRDMMAQDSAHRHSEPAQAAAPEAPQGN